MSTWLAEAAETGVPALDSVLVWGGAVSLLGGLVAVVWRLVRGAARFGRRVNEFIDDWRGEPARPGVPPRPGVMERMGRLEERMGGVEGDLQRIKHELYPDSGASLRDAVDLANRRLALLCPETCAPGGPEPGSSRVDPGGDGGARGEDVVGVTGEDTGGVAGDTGGR
ncbi:hypothetical protein ACH437_30545 [Streptomyces xinghaiensis]|uniref:hypothetical protein n=1 Tax=Streptomyces xinghaiensis TaxID=1038928 RepID=UPI0037A73B1C